MLIEDVNNYWGVVKLPFEVKIRIFWQILEMKSISNLDTFQMTPIKEPKGMYVGIGIPYIKIQKDTKKDHFTLHTTTPVLVFHSVRCVYLLQRSHESIQDLEKICS